MDEIRKLWMPVTKDSDGKYHAILSDDSIDRDDEFMSKELINDWAENKVLPALANHENKMEKWVGGWDNLKSITKENRTALKANPWFFSKDANPLAQQIKKQVDEAIAKGLNPGISISAIPKSHTDVEGDDKVTRRRWDTAELIEATWVPIQSNRNASYQTVAKSFDLVSKKQTMEDKKMDEDVLKQKEVELEKANSELKDLKKSKEELDNSNKELTEKVETLEKEKKETEEKLSESDKVSKKFEDANKENSDLKEKVEQLEKEAKMPNGGGSGELDEKGNPIEDLTKEEGGKLKKMLKTVYNPGGK